ncbi:MAG: hypothetical protein E7215_09505 [Clostridium sulfidigenes]|uniref:Uncharacterized protein n=1 Tax=Clostridium sulfidigenes TaxID=318464 RepID=A0A927WB21_9CLOT|nr:hypothetical protein [Clostridium sulfidigenes]
MDNPQSIKEEFNTLINSITNEIFKNALYKNVNNLNNKMIDVSGSIKENLEGINKSVNHLSQLDHKITPTAVSIENAAKNINENVDKLNTYVIEIVSKNKEDLFNSIKLSIGNSLRSFRNKLLVLLGGNIVLSLIILILLIIKR